MIAGIWVERRIECPLCGTASFLGEWMTPKETQGTAHEDVRLLLSGGRYGVLGSPTREEKRYSFTK